MVGIVDLAAGLVCLVAFAGMVSQGADPQLATLAGGILLAGLAAEWWES